MYLTINYSFSDLRPLLGEEGLAYPSWKSLPRPNDEFVHCFGMVRRRENDPGPWADEIFFADSSHAIRLPQLEKQIIGKLIHPKCKFRGFFKDNDGIVAHCSLGISADISKTMQQIGTSVKGWNRLDSKDMCYVVRDFLHLPVYIPLPENMGNTLDNSVKYECLYEAGQSLVDLYYHSTRPKDPTRKTIVYTQDPLVIITYRDFEVSQLPKYSVPIKPDCVQGSKVFYWRFRVARGYCIGVWFLDETSNTKYNLRRLRLGLGRLHAERRSLQEVWGLYQQGLITNREALVKYLKKRIGLLSEEYKYGTKQQDIADIVEVYEQPLFEGENTCFKDMMVLLGEEMKMKAISINTVSTPRKKIFICYSHQDGDVKASLERLLAGIKGISWSDTNIEAGEKWHSSIKRELSECQAAVLLVSPDFLASDYIAEVELPELIQRRNEDNVVLRPVFVHNVPERIWSHRTGGMQGFMNTSPCNSLMDQFTEEGRNQVLLKLVDQLCEDLRIGDLSQYE